MRNASRMSAYRRNFDSTKHNFLLIKNDELLKQYEGICDKVKSSIKKELIVSL